jgi:hypothetical protein
MFLVTNREKRRRSRNQALGGIYVDAISRM